MTRPIVSPPAGDIGLRLLGGFELVVDGRSVSVPEAARRLIAFLALRGASVRSSVAGTLWPDADDGTVLARLRSAVWRANAVVPGIVATRDRHIVLALWIGIDADELLQRSSQIIAEGQLPPPDVDERDIAELVAKELLPEWNDDWVVEEREYIRQVQLHGLEALAAALTAKQWYAGALESAMRAVQIDPMRESAHRAVIQVHLAERNVAEAVRHYRKLQRLLEHELGVAASPDIEALLDSALGQAGHGDRPRIPASPG